MACNKDITNFEKRIVKIKAEDAQNDEETKRSVARLKDEREATKNRNEYSITASKNETGISNREIVRLQKLLKKFS